MSAKSTSDFVSRVFAKTTIKSQIWLGFGLLLAILLFVSLSTLKVFAQLDKGISEVTESIQPVVLGAQNLETELEAASNALGFFLLTKETIYRNRYSQHLGTAISLVDQLAAYDFVLANEQYKVDVAMVHSDLQQLAAYRDRMLALGASDVDNIPAQQIASQKLNPMAQQLQSMISQMINSDYEEDNSDGSRDEFRQVIYDLRYYNVQMSSELRTFLAFRSTSSVENMRAIWDVVKTKLGVIEASEDLYTFEQDEVVSQVIALYETYYAGIMEAVEVHSTDRYRTDIYLVKSEIGPLTAKIESNLGLLVDQLKQHISDTGVQLQLEASNAGDKVFTGMAGGVLIGVLIAFFMVRMMSLPLNAAVDAMEDLAEGEGDLTHRLNDNGRSEIAIMSRNFNNFAEKVQKLVAQVALGVENLSSVVADVSEIVDQTQTGAERQRQQTDYVNTAISEMSSSVQDVASSANQAADSARLADSNVQSGQRVVDETISSIHTLAEEIETGVNVINALSSEVQSIGSVLDVIKGIAEQTNLLALNAAIEAARAGEQGRGFAVVADEVRTLASRTRESTVEIEAMIEKLHSQARDAVDVISQGQQKANASVASASNAGIALTEITASVNTISNMNMQIATASEQQSAVAVEISENVVSINAVADENARASNMLASSSENLAQIAAELREVVSHFKY
ncbi:MAG: HAMP domain-containing methyl-accepting chemotaxis protein [Gammaproteobacteria bacterium]|nr:HAMP domain-containing methyl-accepting chemotaxis protein [Gammaproteobacteria bacterium]